MQQLLPWIQTRFYYKNSTLPLSEGLVYFYFTGTTHLAPTFESKGGAQNTNPVELDIVGQAEIWLDDSTTYDVVIRDKNGALQDTVEGIVASSSGGGGGGLSFVTTANSTTISLEGLGTAINPLTANALISSITANALGITSSGSGGLFVMDLSDAISDKLDKVQAGAQSVVSEVELKQGLDISGLNPDNSAIRIPDGSWIRPQTSGGSLYLTNASDPSSVNSALWLTDGDTRLYSGDGTNALNSITMTSTDMLLSHFVGGNLKDSLVLQDENLALQSISGRGLSMNSTDVDISNTTSNITMNTNGIRFNGNVGGYEFVNVQAGTPAFTLSQDSSGYLVKSTPVDISDKLDKVQTGAQSVVSEVDLKGGLEVSGALASGLNIKLPSGGSYIGNGTNPANGSRIEFSTYIALKDSINNQITSINGTDWSYTAQGGSHIFSDATNTVAQLNHTSTVFNALNYVIQNVPTGTPAFTYAQDSSGNLVKYVDGASTPQDLESVLTEGNVSTLGATFGGNLDITSDSTFTSLKISTALAFTRQEYYLSGVLSAELLIDSSKIQYSHTNNPNAEHLWNISGVTRLTLSPDSLKSTGRMLQGGVTDNGSQWGIQGESLRVDGVGEFGGDISTAKAYGYNNFNTSQNLTMGETASGSVNSNNIHSFSIRTKGNGANSAEFNLIAHKRNGSSQSSIEDVFLKYNSSTAQMLGDLVVSGDITATIPTGTQVGLVGYDSTGKLIQGSSGVSDLNRTLTLELPTANEDITIWKTSVAITLTQVSSVSTGTTPSTTYIIKHSTDRSATGNSGTISKVTTNKTSGENATLSDATIPANSWIWLETTAASGVAVTISVNLKYTED